MGCSGLIFTGRRIINNRSGDPAPIPETVGETLAFTGQNNGETSAFTTINNNIISTNDTEEINNNLPSLCQDTLKKMNCISASLSTGEQEGFALYYQKTISERNILPNKELLSACETQQEFLAGLTGTNC